MLVGGVQLTDMAQEFELPLYWLSWVGYSILPNFQVLWQSDALTQRHVIPLSHVWLTSLYGLAYIAVALGLAVIMFQRREVG